MEPLPVPERQPRAQAVGVDWSLMPEGYDREQYEAFWGAGYEVGDMQALAELWQTDYIETKARAGQMLLDGLTPPVLPGTMPERPVPVDRDEPVADDVDAEAWNAFWAAGYSEQDLRMLVELWQEDVSEVKTRAGRLLLAGQELPIRPSATPTRGAVGADSLEGGDRGARPPVPAP